MLAAVGFWYVADVAVVAFMLLFVLVWQLLPVCCTPMYAALGAPAVAVLPLVYPVETVALPITLPDRLRQLQV